MIPIAGVMLATSARRSPRAGAPVVAMPAVTIDKVMVNVAAPPATTMNTRTHRHEGLPLRNVGRASCCATDVRSSPRRDSLDRALGWLEGLRARPVVVRGVQAVSERGGDAGVLEVASWLGRPRGGEGMSDRKPRHGEIVTVTHPATERRRRWCALCSVWTWEVGLKGSNVWRHGRHRTEACRLGFAPLAEPGR